MLELHVAGTRHPELAAHLADWHREFARLAFEGGASGEAHAATVKALFLVLLGLSHLDDLAAIEAPASALHDRIDLVVDALFPS